MRNSWLSSLLVLVVLACNPGQYRKLTKSSAATPERPAPIFGDNFNSFLFKTNITVYGKAFSGLLVTKQMQPQDYRVIFTTELGMKLFDFEFRDTSFTLHYCVPQFNRPKLLKVIRQDIEMLLMNNTKDARFDFFSDKANMYRIYRTGSGKRKNYYFINNTTGELERIEQASRNSKKVEFALTEFHDKFPGRILITHHDIRMSIELNLLKR